MFVRVVTTITSDIDLDSMEPKHSVEIASEEAGLPPDFVAAAAYGGCRATIRSIEEQYPRLRLDDDEEQEAQG